MPIYEYHCPQCGVTFERLAFSEPFDDSCPRCDARCEKVPSLTNFNPHFPAQMGGVHSMAGYGKRARFRAGED